jgi:hypothetical protein
MLSRNAVVRAPIIEPNPATAARVAKPVGPFLNSSLAMTGRSARYDPAKRDDIASTESAASAGGRSRACRKPARRRWKNRASSCSGSNGENRMRDSMKTTIALANA